MDLMSTTERSPLLRNLTEEVRILLNNLHSVPDDQKVMEMIEDFILHDNRTCALRHQEKKSVIDQIFLSTRKDLDLLQPVMEDQTVSEIMVNGLEGIYIEREGRMERVEKRFQSREDLEEVIRRIAAKIHREINELHPILDARLEDGSRVSAVYRNVAINGPVLTIRRFPEHRINMEELIARQTITREAAEFLQKLVIAGYNIFISGGTSSGKTTFLNVLSNYIPKEERVVVIEDSAELQLDEIENLVRLETRIANVQDKGEVTIKQLIRASLRMRPDRIIVGEVRGGEVLDMIQAMNTGHDGSLSTGHGNSTESMLHRLEAMFLTAASFPMDAIRQQIASAIDIMIHLGRLSDKSRKVLEISEVAGYQDGRILLNPLYQYRFHSEADQSGSRNGRLIPTGNPLIHHTKLDWKGLVL